MTNHSTHRPGRSIIRTPVDEHPQTSFGDSPYVEDDSATRFFFQNIKGLTHTSSGEDYKHYLSSLHDLNHVDIAGLAETNSAWSHPHLQWISSNASLDNTETTK